MTKIVKSNGKSLPVLRKGMKAADITKAFDKAAKADQSAATAKPTKTNAKGRKQLVEVPAKPIRRDEIVTVTNDKSGAYVIICAAPEADQPTLMYERNRETSIIRKLAVVGGSYKAVKTEIAKLPVKPARLANGLDSKNAPQSAKAAADSRKGEPKAASVKGQPKAAAPKAEKNKQPSKGADRAYVATDKAVEAKADSWRRHLLLTVMAHKTTDAAKAAHVKSGKFASNKLDFNFCAAKGYIKWAK